MVNCPACLAATGRKGCSEVQHWEIHNVTATQRPELLYISGWNHCNGQPLFWGMNDSQIPDWTSYKGYDWSGIVGLSSPYPRKP